MEKASLEYNFPKSPLTDCCFLYPMIVDCVQNM